MPQATSVTVWRNKIQPHLGERQQVILDALKGDMTNCEIAQKLDMPINTVTPRIFELRQKKLVVEYAKRKCCVTGRTAISWKVNNGSLF